LSFHVLVLLAGLLVGWFKKGSIWNITNIRLRLLWILPVAYLIQHVSITYLSGSMYELAIVASYLALLMFCLLNWKVPGLIWAAGGTLSNFLVMLVNGLRMPAYIPAVQQMDSKLVPLLEKGEFGKSIAMSSSTHLNFLGDIFYVHVQPPSLVSIGDILFAIGLIILIQHAMRSGRSEPSGVNRTESIETP
jgi:hypothetical protein